MDKLVKHILETTCKHFPASVRELQTESEGRQKRKIVEAKQVAAFLLFHWAHLTNDEVAEILGCKQKANVIQYRNKVIEIMEGDRAYRSTIDTIKRDLFKR